MATKKTEILILGAGIGGYACFREMKKLLKKNRIKKTITLIDQNNYFTFTPMLHEAATGSVEPDHCAIPARELLHGTSHEFFQATVHKIHPHKNTVDTSEGEVSYETCVIALGSKVNFFSTPGADTFSYHVRTLPAANRLHEQLITLLEDKDFPKVNVVVVGGGATGVEMAGQLSHLAENEVKKLYPEKKLNVTLVQSGATLLPVAKKKVQELAFAALKNQNVKVVLNAKVTEVKATSVELADSKPMPSHITVWTAGFDFLAPHYLDEEFCCEKQIEVNFFLQHTKKKNLYALGDIALLREKPYPKLGEVAHEQGKYAARHIVSSAQKKKMRGFRYRVKGMLIPIGDWYGIASFGPFVFHGKLAWWLRRTAYLVFIPGFWRRIRVVIDWTLHSFGFRNTTKM